MSTIEKKIGMYYVMMEWNGIEWCIMYIVQCNVFFQVYN